MSGFRPSTRGVAQRLLIVFLAGVLWLTSSLFSPAYAADSADAKRYITADGMDLTAVVQCVPKELSQGNLARALPESQKGAALFK